MTEPTHPTNDPYLFALASRGRWRRLRDRLSKFFFGDDIFISYARADAAEYAAGLAARLTKRGFICYLDQFGSKPDTEMPPELMEQLRRSTSLVLVGTEKAAASSNVRKEIELFKKTGRTVIPVDVGRVLREEVEKARQLEGGWKDIAGLALIEETTERVRAGNVSPRVVNLVKNSFRYRRRNQWQRFFLFAGSSFVALTVLAAAAVSGFLITSAQAQAEFIQAEARREVLAAEQASERAAQNERAARATADASRVAADKAEDEAEGARLTRDLAVEQQKAAEQGMLEARRLEAEAKESAAAATRQGMGQRALILSRAPGHEFEAVGLAAKAAGPELKSRRGVSEQVMEGLTASVNTFGDALPLRVEGDEILDSAISPDGRLVFLSVLHQKHDSNWTESWHLLDARTGGPLSEKPLAEHDTGEAPPSEVSFSRDGRRLAVVSFVNDELSVWDAASGARVPVKIGMASLAALDRDGGRLAVARDENGVSAVSVVNLATGRSERVKHEFEKVTALAFGPDGGLWLQGRGAGESSAALPVRDTRTGATFKIAGELSGVTDDGLLVSLKTVREAGKDVKPDEDEVYLCDPTDRRRLLTFSGFGGLISSAAFADGRIRAVTVSGSKARIAGVRAFGDFAVLRAHNRPVSASAFAPDGRTAATGDRRGTAVLWDTLEGKILRTLTTGRKDAVAALTFSKDGKRLAAATLGNAVASWDSATGRGCVSSSPAPDDFVEEDLKAGEDAGAEGGKGAEGVEVARPSGSQPASLSPSAVVFTSDGNKVVTGGFSSVVDVWDAHTCQHLKTLELGPPRDTWFESFAPDGTGVLAFVDDRRAVRLLDIGRTDALAEGATLPTLGNWPIPEGRKPAYAYYRSGGVQLLLADKDGGVEVWRPGRPPQRLNASAAAPPSGGVVSADGNLLVAPDGDIAKGNARVRIWDLRTRETTLFFPDPARGIDDAGGSVAISPDGARLLVTAGNRAYLYPTSMKSFLDIALRLLNNEPGSR
jgi:WD40 repeat protein